METANKAFTEGYELHWGEETKFVSEISDEQLHIIGEPVYPSVSVDAAWNTERKDGISGCRHSSRD